nr:DUF3127 domain-containing protein [Prevotella sp.]
MEIQGKIIAVLPERSGVSARGEWKAQSFVIETHEQYPKKLCFDVFGADRLAQFNIQSGEELLVSFEIDAHEYQGRFFNQVRAWNVIRPGQQAPMQGGYNVGNPQAGAQAAYQAQQAAMAGAPNPMNPQNPFPPAQQPGAPAGQGDSSDLPF